MQTLDIDLYLEVEVRFNAFLLNSCRHLSWRYDLLVSRSAPLSVLDCVLCQHLTNAWAYSRGRLIDEGLEMRSYECMTKLQTRLAQNICMHPYDERTKLSNQIRFLRSLLLSLKWNKEECLEGGRYYRVQGIAPDQCHMLAIHFSIWSRGLVFAKHQQHFE